MAVSAARSARRRRAARWVAAIAGLCMALWAGVGAQAQEARWITESSPAPSLALRDTEGRDVDIGALKGRMVIVNFWATWCAPCVAEMPSLQALAKRLGNNKATVLGVNYHESTQKIREFQERVPVQFALLRDPWQATSAAWNVTTLPTTFIVDANGVVRYRVVGEVDWNSQQTFERLRRP